MVTIWLQYTIDSSYNSRASYNSRKKKPKISFRFFAFSIGTRMTRQLTSQHTDGLFG